MLGLLGLVLECPSTKFGTLLRVINPEGPLAPSPAGLAAPAACGPRPRAEPWRVQLPSTASPVRVRVLVIVMHGRVRVQQC